MARPWRLRHKLVLGLALVVGSVALLLGGAVLGQSSYQDVMRTTDHKLNEMRVVFLLREPIHRIAAYNDDKKTPEGERVHIRGCIAEARRTLAYYQDELQTKSPSDHLDPDEGDGKRHAVGKIEDALAGLERRVTAAATSVGSQGDRPLIEDPKVRDAYTTLVSESTGLFTLIAGDINRTFERGNADHRRSQIIAGSATALAVLLVLTLLYYFRTWVFTPIQQLQAGVQRVHRGVYDHPIRIRSGDEFEEVANEFNAMTAKMVETQNDLARQVNERSRQLVRSERMVSVGFLAAGVAHEINNPLASIAFCSEALERRLQDVLTKAPTDAEVIEKYLKMIQQEAFRCKQITQKLLDFSRAGDKKREPTDLAGLVGDVLDVARHLQTTRGKQIAFRPEGYVVAPVNAPDLKSVVLNLVVNALDSMDEGGTLAVGLRSAGGFAELSFRDTGCGMTPEVLENIFEPFYTRSRTGNGTGLGLSISHQVVDQHGGTIAAASDGPGRGSTFTVRVPLRVGGEAEVKRAA